jgi:trigger factor
VKSTQQVMQARDRALEALLEQIDIPLPESVVQEEATHNRDSLLQQLERAGATLEGYLEMSNQTEAQFDADLEQRARHAVKVSLVLDQLVREEDLSVDPAELSAYVTRQAEQMGVAPDRLAKQLAEDGRLSFAATEVLRGKAVNLIAERVKVTDASGRPVDIKAALSAPGSAGTEADEDAAEADEDAADAEADAEDAEDADEA